MIRERSSALPSTPRCSSYWKRNLLVALDYGRQINFFTYIVKLYLGKWRRFYQLYIKFESVGHCFAESSTRKLFPLPEIWKQHALLLVFMPEWYNTKTYYQTTFFKILQARLRMKFSFNVFSNMSQIFKLVKYFELKKIVVSSVVQLGGIHVINNFARRFQRCLQMSGGHL